MEIVLDEGRGRILAEAAREISIIAGGLRLYIEAKDAPEIAFAARGVLQRIDMLAGVVAVCSDSDDNRSTDELREAIGIPKTRIHDRT